MSERDIPEYDNVAGNHYDKYNTSNPIARKLMEGFFAGFDELVSLTDADRAFEVGCGEGHLSLRLEERGIPSNGIDLEQEAIDKAVANATALGAKASFSVDNLFTLDVEQNAAPLIVCCEVLEHVPDPQRALNKLRELAKPWLLVSVPNEPIWRIMNMARGKYVGDLGNTPGHIQHWSTGGFRNFLEGTVRLEAVRTPLPWTMALCRCD